MRRPSGHVLDDPPPKAEFKIHQLPTAIDTTTFAEGKYFIRQRRISSKPEVLISPCHRHDFILKFVPDKFQFTSHKKYTARFTVRCVFFIQNTSRKALCIPSIMFRIGNSNTVPNLHLYRNQELNRQDLKSIPSFRVHPCPTNSLPSRYS